MRARPRWPPAWNEFANRLGQRELPRLDRAPLAYGYRLPPPGVLRERPTTVHANVALPGLALHYTLDGSEPHAASPRYAAPVRAAAQARVLQASPPSTRADAQPHRHHRPGTEHGLSMDKARPPIT